MLLRYQVDDLAISQYVAPDAMYNWTGDNNYELWFYETQTNWVNKISPVTS